jgi:hypothetical protein
MTQRFRSFFVEVKDCDRKMLKKVVMAQSGDEAMMIVLNNLPCEMELVDVKVYEATAVPHLKSV